jgi:hypothetical protein
LIDPALQAAVGLSGEKHTPANDGNLQPSLYHSFNIALLLLAEGLS